MENNEIKDQPTTTPPSNKKNKIFIVILILLVICGTWFGVSKYLHSKHHEETDDAQVEANISPVIPRISGYVKEVRVKDNQLVKKGDTLLILDEKDLALKVMQAEAALQTAKSNVGAAEANTNAAKAGVQSTRAGLSTADAQIEAAKVNVWRTTQDYDRYANLIKDHSITQQQYEQALAAKQTSEHQLQILIQQKNQVAQQTNTVASQSNATSSQVGTASAMVKQKEVDVAEAKLNLSYAVVLAQESGMVSKVNIQPGQYLQAAQPVFSIVISKEIWVVANFKETQFEKMKPGQKVIVHADAFPDHVFEATLSSFSPATGSRFALLPPDNSSGNFVKVVQRLPVKIIFNDTADPFVKQLIPGMNVTVDVHLD